MGNAIDEVKNRADIVIVSNDGEGIEFFIEENPLVGDKQSAWRNIYCGKNRFFIYCRKWI